MRSRVVDCLSPTFSRYPSHRSTPEETMENVERTKRGRGGGGAVEARQ